MVSEHLPDDDRGQLMLLGAVVVAVALVGMVVILNGVLFTENVTNQGTRSAVDGAATHHATVRDAVPRLVRHTNRNGVHGSESAVRDEVNASLDHFATTLGTASSRRRAVASDIATVGRPAVGARLRQPDPTRALVSDGGDADWDLAPDADPRRFALTVDASTLAAESTLTENGGSVRPFAVRFTDAGGGPQSVVLYRNSSGYAVVETGSDYPSTTPVGGPCVVAPKGGNVTVDPWAGEAWSGHPVDRPRNPACSFTGGSSLPEPTVRFEAGDRASGTYDVALNDTAHESSNFGDAVGDGQYATHVVYALDVRSAFVTPALDASTTVALSLYDGVGEADGSGIAGGAPAPNPDPDPLPSPSEALTWATAGDWDANADERGVVHESFGDRSDDRVSLGPGARDGDLEGYWPLDESTGSIAYDAANGRDMGATADPAPDRDRPGVAGASSYDFASNAYVYDNDAEVYLDGLREVTLSVWVNADAVGVDGPAVYGNGFGVGYDAGYWYYNRGWNYVGCDCVRGRLPVDGDQVTVRAPDRQTDDWQHLTLTWEHGERMRLYVDGTEAAATSNRVYGRLDDTNYLAVGYDWRGNADEVRVYDRQLSGSEVQSLYDSYRGGSLTTDWRTFEGSPDGSTLRLDDVDATVPTGTDVTVYVEADADGDGTVDATSDPVALDGSGDPYAVSGLSGSASGYRLRVELSTSSPTAGPSFGSATLEGGS